MLYRLTILFFVAVLVPRLQAQPEFITTHSLSKQFVIYGPKEAPKKLRMGRTPLDPSLTAVSCERIKQAVLVELGGVESWRFSNEQARSIYVVLHPTLKQEAVITPIRSLKRFTYRVDLPNEIEPAQLIEAITQAVLLELVNRRSTEQVTQIPLWLTKGISAQVQAVAPETLVLEQHKSQGMVSSSPFAAMNGNLKIDLLVGVREALQKCNPLSVDELCWPETLKAERASHFEPCAQLFVYELLRLKNGRACMTQMLSELPNYLNWQIAFMRAFSPHFKQMVDVEKWWSLTLVNFTGRDRSKMWSREQSVERLDSILKITVKTSEAGPSGSDSTLQDIILKWEPARQKGLFVKVLGQLRALRVRIQPEAVELVDEYCFALENCLKNGQKDPVFILRVLTRNDAAAIRQSTCAKLDELDQKRALLRKNTHPSTREEAVLSALEVTTQRKVSATKQ